MRALPPLEGMRLATLNVAALLLARYSAMLLPLHTAWQTYMHEEDAIFVYGNPDIRWILAFPRRR